MFDTRITNTPFTAAEGFFDNIKYDGSGTAAVVRSTATHDQSLLSTLRATVGPRLPENRELLVRISQEYDDNIAYSPADKTFCSLLSAPDTCTDTFWLIEVAGNTNAIMKDLENEFTNVYRGYTRKKMVTEFFRKEFRCLCFVNEELRAAMVFVEPLGLKRFHYLQAAIPAILPWYFPPEGGMDEVENRLFHSLCDISSSAYGQCLEEIAKRYDIRSIVIRNRLNGFDTAYEREMIMNMENNIRECNETIERLNRDIGTQLSFITSYQYQMAGIQEKINNTEESVLMNYFLSNPNLFLCDTESNDTIRFVCRGPVTYWDEDEAETTIGNKGSTLYNRCNTIITKTRLQKLLTAIFIDRKLKLNLCAAFSFNLRGNVNGLRDFDYDYQQEDYMPNPHINKYACMGGYTQVINEILQKGRNYILAIEQCMASALTLNFVDYTVMGVFGAYLCGDYTDINRRCIVMPDGSVVLPEVAIKWLEDQESEEETTNE